MENSSQWLAQSPCTLIGMVHLLPLLEGRRKPSLEEVLEGALVDAKRLAEAGFDVVMIENFGDAPFYPSRVPPHTVASMAVIAQQIRQLFQEEQFPLRLGINVLRNDARAALAIAAATGADLIRVNVHLGAMVTDQGVLQGEAHDTVRYREQICPGCLLLADLQVKHAAPLVARPLEEEALELAERGRADALIVTGPQTGSPPDPETILRLRQLLPQHPLLAGSGVSPALLPAILPHIQGLIVGTWLKEDQQTTAPVDPQRAAQLVQTVRHLEEEAKE